MSLITTNIISNFIANLWIRAKEVEAGSRYLMCQGYAGGRVRHLSASSCLSRPVIHSPLPHPACYESNHGQGQIE